MRHFCLFVFLGLFVVFPATAQRTWSFEFHLGWAGNLPLPLTIRQAGYPDIKIRRAQYYSEPFVLPYYWDWRLAKRIDKHSIEFEAIHHKLYLKNKPPEVQRFGISHGFNILTLNYVRHFRFFSWRNGLGSVLMHPESTVRNKVWPEGPGFDIKGYRLRGLVYNTGISKQIPLIRKRVYLSTELKATFARATMPIAEGNATVNNIALQAIAGLGVNFAGRKGK
jgi:hypothetical protein